MRFLTVLVVLVTGTSIAYGQKANYHPLKAKSKGYLALTPEPATSTRTPFALLSQLESSSQTIDADLRRMHIDNWRTDSDTKQQVEASTDSILRNLEAALPGMITSVRSTPGDMAVSFKLYRNLGALYDVLSTVTESAGAFGSKNEYRALIKDVSAIERIRRELANSVEHLATAKETELSQLRTELHGAQATVPPKKELRKRTADKQLPTETAMEDRPLPRSDVRRDGVSVTTGFLGASSNENPRIRHNGIRLSGVEFGSPAYEAGLQTGDVILSIDGKYVNSVDELSAEITKRKPGTRVAIRYMRGVTFFDTYAILSVKRQF